MKGTLRTALWLCAVLPAAAAPRPEADLQCVAFGSDPQLECTVRLRTGGAPLAGAQVTLGAAMPSMPMAHTVKPVAAVATGQPGEYRGRLALEMLGVWAVQVDVLKPVRDRIVHRLRIDECRDGQRCTVPPATPAALSIPRKS